MHFKDENEFCKFKSDDLRNYPVYRNILMEFQNYYKLKKHGLKEIDKYLYLAGKKYFEKKP